MQSERAGAPKRKAKRVAKPSASVVGISGSGKASSGVRSGGAVGSGVAKGAKKAAPASKPVSRKQAKQAERGFYKAAAQLDKQVTMRSDAPKTPKAAKALRDSRDVSAQRRAQKKQPDGMRQYMGPNAPYREGEDLKPGALSQDNMFAAARKVAGATTAAEHFVGDTLGASKALRAVDKGASGAIPAVLKNSPLGVIATRLPFGAGDHFKKMGNNVYSDAKATVGGLAGTVGQTASTALLTPKDLPKTVKGIAKESAVQSYEMVRHPIKSSGEHPVQFGLTVAPAAKALDVGLGSAARGFKPPAPIGTRPIPGTAHEAVVLGKRGFVAGKRQKRKARIVKEKIEGKPAKKSGDGWQRKDAKLPKDAKPTKVASRTDSDNVGAEGAGWRGLDWPETRPAKKSVDKWQERPAKPPKPPKGVKRPKTKPYLTKPEPVAPTRRGRAKAKAKSPGKTIAQAGPVRVVRNMGRAATNAKALRGKDLPGIPLSDLEISRLGNYEFGYQTRELLSAKHEAGKAAEREADSKGLKGDERSAFVTNAIEEVGKKMQDALAGELTARYGANRAPLLTRERLDELKVEKVDARSTATSADAAVRKASDDLQRVVENVKVRRTPDNAARVSKPIQRTAKEVRAAEAQVNRAERALGSAREQVGVAKAKAERSGPVRLAPLAEGMAGPLEPRPLRNLRVAKRRVDEAATKVEEAKANRQTVVQRAARIRSNLEGLSPAQQRPLREAQTALDNAMAKAEQAGKAAVDAKTRHWDYRSQRPHSLLGPADDTGKLYGTYADARLVADRQPGFSAVPVGDQYGVIPTVLKDTLEQHRRVGKSPATVAVVMRKGRGATTKGVIATKPVRYLLGNAGEGGIRAAIAGATPAHYMFWQNVMERANKIQPGIQSKVEHRVGVGVGQAGGLHEMHQMFEKTWAELADESKRIQPGSASHTAMHVASKGGELFPAKQLIDIMNKSADFVLGTANHPIELAIHRSLAGKKTAEMFGYDAQKAAEALVKDFNGSGSYTHHIAKYNAMEAGQYTNYGPAMREALLHWIPFMPWRLSATKYLASLPSRHPATTIALANTAQGGKQWVKDHPEANFAINQYTGPFGVYGNFVRGTAGTIAPQFMGPLTIASRGVTTFGSPIRDGNDKPIGGGKALGIALAELLKTNNPYLNLIDGSTGAAARYLYSRDPGSIGEINRKRWQPGWAPPEKPVKVELPPGVSQAEFDALVKAAESDAKANKISQAEIDYYTKLAEQEAKSAR